MVFSDYLREVRRRGILVTEAQIRFAIKANRLPQPKMNGAHQFDYSVHDVEAAVQYFPAKTVSSAAAASPEMGVTRAG